MRLGGHNITVRRATTTKDAYGNDIRNWATASAMPVPGCNVQPALGSEVTIGRDAVVSRWVVYAPANTDLLATDRVEWRGDTYEVDGDVQVWDFAPLSHIVALLRRGADQ